MKLLHGECDSIHLLHELRAYKSAERIAAGAGDEDTAVAGSYAGFNLHAMEKLQQFLCLARVMPLVIAPENASASLFNDQSLNRGGPDLQARVTANAGFGRLCLVRQFRPATSEMRVLCARIQGISRSDLVRQRGQACFAIDQSANVQNKVCGNPSDSPAARNRIKRAPQLPMPGGISLDLIKFLAGGSQCLLELRLSLDFSFAQRHLHTTVRADLSFARSLNGQKGHLPKAVHYRRLHAIGL